MPPGKPASRVKVFVRLRPLSGEEEANGVDCVWTVSPDRKELFFRQTDTQGHDSPRLRRLQCLSLNGCFDCHDDNGLVYKEAALPLVQKVLEGTDCCILAYGQTGSGKSYSVFGGPGEEGILTRSMRDIFKFISTRDRQTFLNEDDAASLVSPERDSSEVAGREAQGFIVHVKEMPHTKTFYVENLCEVQVDSCEDLEELLLHCHQEWKPLVVQRALQMLRSHVVVFVRLVASSNLWRMGRMSRAEAGSSCLTLVDLAGCERMTRCRAARLRQPEGAAELQEQKPRCAESMVINKSLFFLRNCLLSAFLLHKVILPFFKGSPFVILDSLCFGSLIKQEKRRRGEVRLIGLDARAFPQPESAFARFLRHQRRYLSLQATAPCNGSGCGRAEIPIPYRYSNLTRILARSLHSDASIVLLVTLNPSRYATQQSLHALEFAHRASHLREKQPRKGEAYKKHLLTRQQEMLKQLRRTAESLKLKAPACWHATSSDSLQELQEAAHLHQELLSKFELLAAILSRQTTKKHIGDLQSWFPPTDLEDVSLKSEPASVGFIAKCKCTPDHGRAPSLLREHSQSSCTHPFNECVGEKDQQTNLIGKQLDEAFAATSSDNRIPVLDIGTPATGTLTDEFSVSAVQPQPEKQFEEEPVALKRTVRGMQTCHGQLTALQGGTPDPSMTATPEQPYGGHGNFMPQFLACYQQQLAPAQSLPHEPSGSLNPLHIDRQYMWQQWLPPASLQHLAVHRKPAQTKMERLHTPSYVQGLPMYYTYVQLPSRYTAAIPLHLWLPYVPRIPAEELFYGHIGAPLPTVTANMKMGPVFSASRRQPLQAPCLGTGSTQFS
ncbi:hypothetical protein Efla_004845 [Eimeria flavescens]